MDQILGTPLSVTQYSSTAPHIVAFKMSISINHNLCQTD